MATVLEPEVRKFTIAEYYRLAETGILAPSERVELLDGKIIRMAPIGPRHATIVDKLTGILVLGEKGRYRTGPGRPIRISNFNEPQPDLVLYKREIENRHPTSAEIYLTIEVADTTLDYDSGEKMRAYEQGGIKEYWIIDVAKKAVNIYHLSAQGHKYMSESRTHGVIAPQAFPDVTVHLTDLF
jgi:Uma2 family endonuclease